LFNSGNKRCWINVILSIGEFNKYAQLPARRVIVQTAPPVAVGGGK